MTRSPCCQKTGLKKGPWSPEEDKILVAHINNHGHSNWRALPKQAGLLRCGKSCRLRWTNYLNPNIKRGNFSREEEDKIINLHRVLGNKWSAIAAELPGRTDNEIKNVWHTHLKKRLIDKNLPILIPETPPAVQTLSYDSGSTKGGDQSNGTYSSYVESSPSAAYIDSKYLAKEEFIEYSEEYKPEIDESFWSESQSSDIIAGPPGPSTDAYRSSYASFEVDSICDFSSTSELDDLEFWCNILVESGGMTELPEL